MLHIESVFRELPDYDAKLMNLQEKKRDKKTKKALAQIKPKQI